MLRVGLEMPRAQWLGAGVPLKGQQRLGTVTGELPRIDRADGRRYRSLRRIGMGGGRTVGGISNTRDYDRSSRKIGWGRGKQGCRFWPVFCGETKTAAAEVVNVWALNKLRATGCRIAQRDEFVAYSGKSTSAEPQSETASIKTTSPAAPIVSVVRADLARCGGRGRSRSEPVEASLLV